MTNIIIRLTNTVSGDIYSGAVEVHTDPASTFWKGFALIMVVGIAMLGARWVHQIIGGSHESD